MQEMVELVNAIGQGIDRRLLRLDRNLLFGNLTPEIGNSSLQPSHIISISHWHPRASNSFYPD
jgi:hypothetical protein